MSSNFTLLCVRSFHRDPLRLRIHTTNQCSPSNPIAKKLGEHLVQHAIHYRVHFEKSKAILFGGAKIIIL